MALQGILIQKPGITWRFKEVECKEDRKLSNRSSASMPDGNKMSRQSGEVVAPRGGGRIHTVAATTICIVISIIECDGNGNGGIVVPSIVIQSSHNLCQDEGAG